MTGEAHGGDLVDDALQRHVPRLRRPATAAAATAAPAARIACIRTWAPASVSEWSERWCRAHPSSLNLSPAAEAEVVTWKPRDPFQPCPSMGFWHDPQGSNCTSCNAELGRDRKSCLTERRPKSAPGSTASTKLAAGGHN